MKCIYWTAECLDDSKAYSIRERTKKAALAAKAERPADFGPVVKVEVDYDNALDLLAQCLGEGGAWWEPMALDSDNLVPRCKLEVSEYSEGNDA